MKLKTDIDVFSDLEQVLLLLFYWSEFGNMTFNPLGDLRLLWMQACSTGEPNFQYKVTLKTRITCCQSKLLQRSTQSTEVTDNMTSLSCQNFF